eukprot:2890417-Prymnesium_polylepis.1
MPPVLLDSPNKTTCRFSLAPVPRPTVGQGPPSRGLEDPCFGGTWRFDAASQGIAGGVASHQACGDRDGAARSMLSCRAPMRCCPS